jgi:hypothetical protein
VSCLPLSGQGLAELRRSGGRSFERRRKTWPDNPTVIRLCDAKNPTAPLRSRLFSGTKSYAAREARASAPVHNHVVHGLFLASPKTYEFRLPTFLTGIASFQAPYLISGWFMGSHRARERQTSSILNICKYMQVLCLSKTSKYLSG